MNLILLYEKDFINNDKVELSGERYKYIRNIHKPEIDESLKVGLLNGKIGIGRVIKIDNKSILMDVILNEEPPLEIPITLIIALPRPKVFRRIIQSITTIGIKKIYIINAFRVEKSYWQSPFLKSDAIKENLKTGLSQAVDTIEPEIFKRKYFKPFVEDELENISNDSLKVVAHPNGKNIFRNDLKKTTLVIGPEGGFIEYELNKLKTIGFDVVGMGKRVLKVETAIPFILSKFTG